MFLLKFVIISVLSFLISSMCRFSNNKNVERLKQQPPSYVFRIIWPFLYLCIAYVWSRTNQIEIIILFYTLISLFILWIYLYNCVQNKIICIYILSLCIAIVICIISLHRLSICKIIMIPLLSWLIIAFHLNWDHVNKKKYINN